MKSFTTESITRDLKETGTCNIPGIGKLVVKIRPAKKGTNPLTGAPMDVPERKSVALKVSSTIKAALNA